MSARQQRDLAKLVNENRDVVDAAKRLPDRQRGKKLRPILLMPPTEGSSKKVKVAWDLAIAAAQAAADERGGR